MTPSKEAMYFINHCYKNGQPVAINPKFNVKYEFEGKEIKFTEDLLNEIISSELVKVSNQTDKMVNLNGIGG